MRHPNLLRRDDTVLVVVDVQAALLPAIAGRESLLANVQLLVEAAKILEVPTLITTQYAARLGESVIPGAAFDKLTFSCTGADGFCEALAETWRRQVLLCGVETHICVSQTAHALLARGFQVNVAPDAVSSRTVRSISWGWSGCGTREFSPLPPRPLSMSGLSEQEHLSSRRSCRW